MTLLPALYCRPDDPLLALYCYYNRPLLLPPAAKLTPYCLPTAPQAQKKNCQKMAVKAVNDSAGLDGLIPMLLVFNLPLGQPLFLWQILGQQDLYYNSK